MGSAVLVEFGWETDGDGVRLDWQTGQWSLEEEGPKGVEQQQNYCSSYGVSNCLRR